MDCIHIYTFSPIKYILHLYYFSDHLSVTITLIPPPFKRKSSDKKGQEPITYLKNDSF
jgi:hypothetical protein